MCGHETRQKEPGVIVHTRLFCFLPLFVSVILAALSAAFSDSAYGFDVRLAGGPPFHRLARRDLMENGLPFTQGAEQSLARGNTTATLVDFADGIDLGITAGNVGEVSANAEDRRYLLIRLSRAEQRQCLDENDFFVTMAVTDPAPDVLASASGNGTLSVTQLNPVFDRSSGGRCPRELIYGHDLIVNVNDAIDSGEYVGSLEISAERIGTGQIETLTTSLTVRVPSILLMYYYTRVDIDVLPGALAGALGVPASACGSDWCVSLGNKTIPTPTPSVANADIEADVPALVATPEIVLRNAVAVRAIGCAGGVYTQASYAVTSIQGVVPRVSDVAEILGQPCGMTIVPGNLSFSIDLNTVAIDPNTAEALADIVVTIAGF